MFSFYYYKLLLLILLLVVLLVLIISISIISIIISGQVIIYKMIKNKQVHIKKHTFTIQLVLALL